MVAIASSRVENSEEIHQRLTDALDHIDARRLVVAPDCGLGYLPRELAQTRLRHVCRAARSIGA